MDYDDIQDKKEALFAERKSGYLNGDKFKVSTWWESLDALLMKMYLSDVTSYESTARYDQGVNMMHRQIAHVRHLSVMDYGDAEDEHVKLCGSTFGDWLIKAFRKDEDFVDEAVSHIIGGTAQKFFE